MDHNEELKLLEKETKESKTPWVGSCRFQLGMLAFMATFNLYLARTSMSVAIVCMTYDPHVNLTEVKKIQQDYKDNNCSFENVRYVDTKHKMCSMRTVNTSLFESDGALSGGNVTKKSLSEDSHHSVYTEDTDDNGCPLVVNSKLLLRDLSQVELFPWPRQLKGFILSSYYVGYTLTQILASFIARRFGSKIPIMISMMTNVVLSMGTPAAAKINVYFLIAVQMLKGTLSGLHYPLFYHMIGVWSPPFERSVMVALLFSGAPIGAVVSSALSGFLCVHGYAGGWPSIFYTFGIMQAVLAIIWIFSAYDKPEDHPRISEDEKELLMKYAPQSGDDATKTRPVPIKAMMTSIPLLTIFFTNVSYCWAWFVVQTSLPQFMHDVLEFDIKSNGVLSGIPYITNWFLSLVGSVIADQIAKREVMSKTNLRKIFQTLGMFPGVFFAVGVAYISSCHDRTLAVVFLSFWIGLLGFTRSGADVSQMEIAPAFAGIVMGIDQTITGLAAIAAPSVVSALVPNGRREQWRTVFLVTAITSFIGWVAFTALSSSEEAEWAKPDEKEDMEETGGNIQCREVVPYVRDRGRYTINTAKVLINKNGTWAFLRFLLLHCLWDMSYR